MWGAVIGDIAGSRFEGSRGGPKTFELFHRRCTFTDDTVCTATRDRVGRSGLVAWPRIRRVAQDLAERLRFQGRIEAPAPTNSGRIVVMSGGRVRDEIPLPAFDERRILDAAFAARNRERDHGEAIRGWLEIHDQST